MKPKALYPDDIRELIERVQDDVGDIPEKTRAAIERHALAIMSENQTPSDDK